ncbi:MAG: thioesterase family protein [Akkermansiaceae bacterium]|nr:thioesterase family protein [Akkermansiaceae bacterium]
MEAPTYRHPAEIAFADTDASGWMHFPTIFRHIEVAEHACLKKLGVLVFDRKQGGWPRVNVNSDFRKPLLAGDAIEVLLRIAKLGSSSIVWEFEVLNAQGEVAVSGTMTNVRVDATGKTQAISEEERKALNSQ